jgi:ankyrin repeat protein
MTLSPSNSIISPWQDVNMTDAESRTPLHYATAHRHPIIISTLVEAGANLEATDSKVGRASSTTTLTPPLTAQSASNIICDTRNGNGEVAARETAK